MPSSSEIARVMAEMDRFNKSVTVTEERYEKRVASVGGSYGGLTALLQQGAPGNWASDHKSEAEKFSGWHYVAITSIGKAVRSSDVEAYQEKVREYAKGYNEQDEDTTPLPKWHPLMKLLKRPNPSQSGASFREEMAIQLCLTGSALVWNVPNQMGRTVERYVIPTAIAEPRQPEKGLPKGGWYINPEVARWQIESGWFLYTGLATAIGKVIDARDVQVVRFIHPVFKDEGQSPVSAGALWTDTSEKIDISRHAHLRNGSDPSVIIGIDGVEDEGTLQRMSAKFNEKYAGPSKHGKAMFVNGQNVKVEPVTRTPAEMAYEGAFAQFRDAIMALHGVTPIAAGIEAPSGDDGLYAPLKQFVVGTVQPILDLMAEEDTEQLASQFGEGVSVLYTARAIDDAKLTEQQINTDIAAGAIEVDEIRKLRGRKPWGGEKGKAVAGQGAKEEPQQGLLGLAQGVPGLEPQTGSQALDPSNPPKGTPDPMKLAEEAVAKALGGFADRLSALLKSGDNCGTGAGGFQEGNTCGQRRAVKGGQVGMNGEFYAGGQFLPSTDMPKKVRADMERIASGKSKVDEGVYEKLTPGEFAPYEMIGTFLEKAGRDGEGKLQVKASNDRALAYMGVDTQEKIGQLQSIINRFNAGERKLQVFDYPSFPSAKDIIRALNANLPIPESMLPRLQGNLAKYVTRNGEAAGKAKSGDNCGTGAGGFKPGNDCARGEGSDVPEKKKRGKKAGKSEPKEFWEMTPGEFRRANNQALVDALTDTSSYGAMRYVKPGELRVGESGELEIKRVPPGGKLKDKPTWNRLSDGEEEILREKLGVESRDHEGEIERAIQSGEPVPKEVADYFPKNDLIYEHFSSKPSSSSIRANEIGGSGNKFTYFIDIGKERDITEEVLDYVNSIHKLPASDRDDLASDLFDKLPILRSDYDKLTEEAANIDPKYGKWMESRVELQRERDKESDAAREAYFQELRDSANKPKRRTRKKSFFKSSDCGANAEGGGGFQPGNTCGREDGSGESGGDDDYRIAHKAPGRGRGAPLDDMTGGGEVYPDDIYSDKAARYYGTGEPAMDRKTIKIIQSLKGNPEAEVTIYRAVPSDVEGGINPGDWVTINRDYAVMHGEGPLEGDYRILELKARASDVYGNGDSIHEYGYDPAPKKKSLGKSGSSCGANAQGGGGFQPGNTCGKRDGKGGESSEGGGNGASVNPKILAWAREKFGDDTTAENFAKWFGDSKVVDGDGNPLIVYHGAKDKITDGTFRMENGLLGKGAYFTTNTDEADFYATNASWRTKAQIVPAFVNISNPYITSDKNDKAAKKSSENGHDGVFLVDSTGKIEWAIPFSPTQIKSATGNSGTFDPKDPNITKSGSGCGANAEGGGGFQPGNTCGKRDGKGGESSEGGGNGASVNPKILAWAREKFGDDTTAENFAKWFGDSKVVDADGNPLVVYHGTDAEFTEFKPGNPSAAGSGIYFAENPKITETFNEFRDGGKTYPVYLAIEKPFDFGGQVSQNEAIALIDTAKKVSPESFDQSSAFGRHAEPDYREQIKKASKSGTIDGYTVWDSMRKAVGKENVNKVIEAAGYDGLLHNVRDGAGTPAQSGEEKDDLGLVWVAFKPTQIKSATGNSGTFDPKDPNITKSGSGCGANAEGGGGFQPGNTCGKEDGAGEAQKQGEVKPRGDFAKAREAAKADLDRIRGEVIKTAEEWTAKIEEAKKVADAEFDKIAGATEPMEKAWKNMKGKTGEEKAEALRLYEAEAAKFDALRGPANEAQARYRKMQEDARVAAAAVLGKESLLLSESLGITDKHQQSQEENSQLIYSLLGVVVEDSQALKDPSAMKSVTTGRAREARIAATEFLDSMLHPAIHQSALRSEVVYREHGERASANPIKRGWNEAKQSDDDDKTGFSSFPLDATSSTYIHEYGHQVEFGSQEIRNLTLDFLASRTQGEEIVSLKEKYPDSNYDEWERGAKDGFAKAHEAAGFAPEDAESKAYYAGKSYGTRLTELLPMGFELMHKDAAAFAKADPEWFDLVAGIATGRLLPIAQKRLKNGK